MWALLCLVTINIGYRSRIASHQIRIKGDSRVSHHRRFLCANQGPEAWLWVSCLARTNDGGGCEPINDCKRGSERGRGMFLRASYCSSVGHVVALRPADVVEPTNTHAEVDTAVGRQHAREWRWHGGQALG